MTDDRPDRYALSHSGAGDTRPGAQQREDEAGDEGAGIAESAERRRGSRGRELRVGASAAVLAAARMR